MQFQPFFAGGNSLESYQKLMRKKSGNEIRLNRIDIWQSIAVADKSLNLNNDVLHRLIVWFS